MSFISPQQPQPPGAINPLAPQFPTPHKPTQTPHSHIPAGLQLICHDISQFYINYRQLCIITLQYHNGTLPPNAPKDQIALIVQKCKDETRHFIVYIETLVRLLLRSSTYHRAVSFDIVFGLTSRVLMERELFPTFHDQHNIILDLFLKATSLVLESVLLLPVPQLKILQLTQLQSFSSLLFFLVSFFKPKQPHPSPSSPHQDTPINSLVPNTDYPENTIYSLFRSIQVLLLIAAKLNNPLILASLTSQPLLPLIQLVASVCVEVIPRSHDNPDLQQQAIFLCDIIRSTYASDTIFIVPPSSSPETSNQSGLVPNNMGSGGEGNGQNSSELVLYWSLLFAYQRAIADAESALLASISNQSNNQVNQDGTVADGGIELMTPGAQEHQELATPSSPSDLLKFWASLPQTYLYSHSPSSIMDAVPEGKNIAQMVTLLSNEYHSLLVYPRTHQSLLTSLISPADITQQQQYQQNNGNNTQGASNVVSFSTNSANSANNSTNSANLLPSGLKLRTLTQKRDQILLGSEALCGILPGILSMCFNMLTANNHQNTSANNNKDSKSSKNRAENGFFSGNIETKTSGSGRRRQNQFTTVALLQLWTSTIVSCCSDNILRLLLICPRHLEHHAGKSHGAIGFGGVSVAAIVDKSGESGQGGKRSGEESGVVVETNIGQQNDKSDQNGQQNDKNGAIHPTLQLLFNTIPSISRFLDKTPALPTIANTKQTVSAAINSPTPTSTTLTTSTPTAPITTTAPTLPTALSDSTSQPSPLPSQPTALVDALTPEWLSTTISRPPFQFLYPLIEPTPQQTPTPTPTPPTTLSSLDLSSLLDPSHLQSDTDRIKNLQFTGIRTKQWLSSTQTRISDLITILYNPLSAPSHLLSTPHTLIALILSAYTLLYHCPIFLFDQRIVLLDILVAAVYHKPTSISTADNASTNNSTSSTTITQTQPLNESILAKQLIHLIFSKSVPTPHPSILPPSFIPSPLVPNSASGHLVGHFLQHLSHPQQISNLSMTFLVGSQCYCDLFAEFGDQFYPQYEWNEGIETGESQSKLRVEGKRDNPRGRPGWTISSLLFDFNSTNAAAQTAQNGQNSDQNGHDLYERHQREVFKSRIRLETHSTNLFQLTIQRLITLSRHLRYVNSNHGPNLNNFDLEDTNFGFFGSSGSQNAFGPTGDLYRRSQQLFLVQLVLGYLELIPALTALVNHYYKVNAFITKQNGQNGQNLAQNDQNSTQNGQKSTQTPPPPTTFSSLVLENISPIVTSLCQILRLQVGPDYTPDNSNNSSLNQISLYPTPTPIHFPHSTISHSSLRPFYEQFPTELLRQIPQRLIWALDGAAVIKMLQILNFSISISLSSYCSTFVTFGLSLSNPIAQYQNATIGTGSENGGGMGQFEQFGGSKGVKMLLSENIDTNDQNDENDEFDEDDESDNFDENDPDFDQDGVFQRTSRLLGMKSSTLSTISSLNLSLSSSRQNSTAASIMNSSGAGMGAGRVVLNGNETDQDQYHAGIKINQMLTSVTAPSFRRGTYTRIVSEVRDGEVFRANLSGLGSENENIDYLFANSNHGSPSSTNGGRGGHNARTAERNPNGVFDSNFGGNSLFLLERLYLLYLFYIGTKSLIHYYLDTKTMRINPLQNHTTNWTTPSSPPPLADLQATLESTLTVLFSPPSSSQSNPYQDPTNPFAISMLTPTQHAPTLFTLPNHPHHLISTSLSLIHNLPSLTTHPSSFSPSLSPQATTHLGMNYLYTTHLQALSTRIVALLLSLSKPQRRQPLLSSTTTPILRHLLTKLAISQSKAVSSQLGSSLGAAAVTASNSMFLLSQDLQRSLFDISVLIYPPPPPLPSTPAAAPTLQTTPLFPSQSPPSPQPHNNHDQNLNRDHYLHDRTNEVIGTMVANNIENLVNGITLKLNQAIQLDNLENHLRSLPISAHSDSNAVAFGDDDVSATGRFVGTLHDVIMSITQLRASFQQMLQIFLISASPVSSPASGYSNRGGLDDIDQTDGEFGMGGQNNQNGDQNDRNGQNGQNNGQNVQSGYYTPHQLSQLLHLSLLHWRTSIKRAESILRHYEVNIEEKLGLPLLLSFILTSTTPDVNPSSNYHLLPSSPSATPTFISFPLLRDVLSPTFELLSALVQKYHVLMGSSSFTQTDTNFIPSFAAYHSAEQDYIASSFRHYLNRAGPLGGGPNKTSFDFQKEHQILSFLSTRQTYKYVISMTLCYLDVIHTIILTMGTHAKVVFENARYDFWFEYLKRHLGRSIRDDMHRKSREEVVGSQAEDEMLGREFWNGIGKGQSGHKRANFDQSGMNDGVDGNQIDQNSQLQCNKCLKAYTPSHSTPFSSSPIISQSKSLIDLADEQKKNSHKLVEFSSSQKLQNFQNSQNPRTDRNGFQIEPQTIKFPIISSPTTSTSLTSHNSALPPSSLTSDTLSLLVTSQDNDSYIASGKGSVVELCTDPKSGQLCVLKRGLSTEDQVSDLRSLVQRKMAEKERSQQQYRRYFVHQSNAGGARVADLSTIWVSLQEKEAKKAQKGVSFEQLERNSVFNENDPLGERNGDLNGDEDGKEGFVDSDFDEEVTIGRPVQRPEHLLLGETLVQAERARQAEMISWVRGDKGRGARKDELREKVKGVSSTNTTNSPNSPNPQHVSNLTNSLTSINNHEQCCPSCSSSCETDVPSSNVTASATDKGFGPEPSAGKSVDCSQNLKSETPKRQSKSTASSSSFSEAPFDPYLDDPLWISPPKFNNYVNDDENPRPSTIEEQQIERLLHFITPFLTLPSMEPIIINKVIAIITKCIMTMNFIGKLPHLYLSSHSSGMSVSGSSRTNPQNDPGQQHHQHARFVQSRRETLRQEYKQQMRSLGMKNGTFSQKKKNMFAGMVRSREGWDLDADATNIAAQAAIRDAMKAKETVEGELDGDVTAEWNVPFPNGQDLSTMLDQVRGNLLNGDGAMFTQDSTGNGQDNIHARGQSGQNSQNAENSQNSQNFTPFPSSVSEVVFIDTLLAYIFQKSNLTFLLPPHLQHYSQQRQSFGLGQEENENNFHKFQQFAQNDPSDQNSRTTNSLHLPPVISSLLPTVLPSFPLHMRWDARLLPLLTSLWPSVKLLLSPLPPSFYTSSGSLDASGTPITTIAFYPSTLKLLGTIATLSHGFFSTRFVSEMYPYLAQMLMTQRIALLNVIQGQGFMEMAKEHLDSRQKRYQNGKSSKNGPSGDFQQENETFRSSPSFSTITSSMRTILSTLHLLKTILLSAPSIAHALCAFAPVSDSRAGVLGTPGAPANSSPSQLTFIELILSFSSPLLPPQIRSLSSEIIAVLMLYKREVVTVQLLGVLEKMGVESSTVTNLVQFVQDRPGPNSQQNSLPNISNSTYFSTGTGVDTNTGTHAPFGSPDHAWASQSSPSQPQPQYRPLHLHLRMLQHQTVQHEQENYLNRRCDNENGNGNENQRDPDETLLDKFTRRETMMAFWDIILTSNSNLSGQTHLDNLVYGKFQNQIESCEDNDKMGDGVNSTNALILHPNSHFSTLIESPNTASNYALVETVGHQLQAHINPALPQQLQSAMVDAATGIIELLSIQAGL